MKCVVVDIGNTSTSLGLAAGTRIQRQQRLTGHPVDLRLAEKALRAIVRRESVTHAIVASVVPSATSDWISAIEKILGRPPMVLSHEFRLGVRIDYPTPETIGPDRLANASGAVGRYGSPVIVADFGTALTFDVVAEGDVYVGGVIAPGLPLMTDYLAERTALLPRIQLKGRCYRVGRSTAGAMRIGAHVGYRGIVREIVTYLNREFGAEFILCATGGHARWVLNGIDLPFHVHPDLTLYGLSRIFALNAGGETKA